MDAGRFRAVLRQPAMGRLLDAALAVSLACLAVSDAMVGVYTTTRPEPRWVFAVANGACALFLIDRRRHPVLSAGGAVVCQTVALLLGQQEATIGVLIGLVAVYTMGAYGQRHPMPIAVLLLYPCVAAVISPAEDVWVNFSWPLVVFSATYAVGLAARKLRSRAHTAERHTHLLEDAQRAAAETAARHERSRAARELHDIISHGLGVMMLHAGAADQVLDRDPARAREHLRLIRTTGQTAIAELQTLIELVRDDGTQGRHPQPTLQDIDRLIATTRTAGLDVSLTVEGNVRAIPASVELNAYRVVQEGLTNALKHAHRSTVHVVLRYQPDHVDIEVTDNGADPHPGVGTRRGLIGLRERVTVFSGRFHAGPQPGGGWTVLASFPTTP